MSSDYGAEYRRMRENYVAYRIREVYGQARDDLDYKLYDFWRRHEIKNAIYSRQVANGELSKSDYDAWLRGQVFQGKLWEAKLKQVTDTMVHADETAKDIVNREKGRIFATNANWIGYGLEKGAGADIGFSLYDNQTVARLVEQNPRLIPIAGDDEIDRRYDVGRYRKIVTNCITQGIIQGESVAQICDRITRDCPDRGEKAAMRDARTAFTGAQNAGRVDGMKQAQELGVELKKQWMAIFDDRTRDTHQYLDGETQDVDKPFVTINGNEIMYPGDPDAEPEEVYNCRCTLGYSYPKYPSTLERRDDMTGEAVGDMTYREWSEWKMRQAGDS